MKRFLGLASDDRSPWHELAHWKAEVKDVATVDVGMLDAVLLWDSAREDLSKTLRSHLARLAEEWLDTKPAQRV